MTFKWSATDNITASAKVKYDLEDYSGKYGPGELFEDSTEKSYTATLSGYDAGNADDDCGDDGQQISKWYLTARDLNGNEVTNTVRGGFLRITQDDNLSDTANLAVKPVVSYAGKWTKSLCQCWSNGSDHLTSVQGASATVAVKVPAGDATHVGLVMAKAPNRGSFKVYVDGVLDSTVNTYAANSQARVIVWQGALAAGPHTVKLVNLATPGHPRIDLDAVLTN